MCSSGCLQRENATTPAHSTAGTGVSRASPRGSRSDCGACPSATRGLPATGPLRLRSHRRRCANDRPKLTHTRSLSVLFATELTVSDAQRIVCTPRCAPGEICDTARLHRPDQRRRAPRRPIRRRDRPGRHRPRIRRRDRRVPIFSSRSATISGSSRSGCGAGPDVAPARLSANLSLACDACHALVTNTDAGWTTAPSPRTGRPTWTAPVRIDPERRPRVNIRHHPEEILRRARSRIVPDESDDP